MHAWLFMLCGRGVVATVTNCADMDDAEKNGTCEDDQVAAIQVSSPCGGGGGGGGGGGNDLIDFQVESFTFINNCDEEVVLQDWDQTVGPKQQVSVTTERSSCCYGAACNRLCWQYEGKYQDFIELNQAWKGVGERLTKAFTYSAYWGFSNSSEFKFSGGSCQDEVARFLPRIEDVSQYCDTWTTSHPHRCKSWNTPLPGADPAQSPWTCSAECAGPSPAYAGCGDYAKCQGTNPSSWQCGSDPGQADSATYNNWKLCQYWYNVSWAGEDGGQHTFPSGNYVNYWCGSYKCGKTDLISPGVSLGGSCTAGGTAQLTITTCPNY